MPHLWDTIWTADQYGTKGDWDLADPTTELSNVGGLADKDPLATAIIIALFTDAPEAPPKLSDRTSLLQQTASVATDIDAMQPPPWHGNLFNVEPGEEVLGSQLWRLSRSTLSDYNARLAVRYAADALQVLVRKGWVSHFNIHSEVDKQNNRINLYIQAVQPTGDVRNFYADLVPLQ
jgi:phage gp46-like protein